MISTAPSSAPPRDHVNVISTPSSASLDHVTFSTPSSASRDHVISTDQKTGLTFIAGGKWTTFREMAEDVLNKVLSSNETLKAKAAPCRTDDFPLLGAAPNEHCPSGWNHNVQIQLIQQYGLEEDVAAHLAGTYGTRAFDVMGTRCG